MCRSALITMECYMDAREMDFLDTAQICTIFGNALDNAIEYESRIEETEKRLIKVSVFSENHFLVIKIRNHPEILGRPGNHQRKPGNTRLWNQGNSAGSGKI